MAAILWSIILILLAALIVGTIYFFKNRGSIADNDVGSPKDKKQIMIESQRYCSNCGHFDPFHRHCGNPALYKDEVDLVTGGSKTVKLYPYHENCADDIVGTEYCNWTEADPSYGYVWRKNV